MDTGTYVMAIDIEMSGSTIRGSDGHYPREPEGDLIGIGARVLCWDEAAKKLEIATDLYGTPGSFFRPMFRPFNTYYPFGTLYTESKKTIACPIKEDYKKSKLEFKDAATVRYNESTIFEHRCWDGFWSKETDMLKQLEYKGDLCKRAMESSAISELFEFRRAFETRAHSEDAKLVVVSDNVSFDIGIIDQMLRKYHPNIRPSVYRADNNEKYNGGNPCTHSMQKGLLASVDPLWLIAKDKSLESGWMDWLEARGHAKEYWSPTLRIQFLYDIPKQKTLHDHNPLNDADWIAREYWTIVLIAHGHYTLHEDRVMQKRGREEESEESTTKKSKV